MKHMITIGLLCALSLVSAAETPSLYQVTPGLEFELFGRPAPVEPTLPTLRELRESWDRGLPVTRETLALHPGHEYRPIYGVKAEFGGRVRGVELDYSENGYEVAPGAYLKHVFALDSIRDPLSGAEREVLVVKHLNLGTASSHQGPFEATVGSDGELRFSQFTYKNNELDMSAWLEWSCRRYEPDARRAVICRIVYDNTESQDAERYRSFEGYRVLRIFRDGTS